MLTDLRIVANARSLNSSLPPHFSVTCASSPFFSGVDSDL
jgi:hypothetical protein